MPVCSVKVGIIYDDSILQQHSCYLPKKHAVYHDGGDGSAAEQRAVHSCETDPIDVMAMMAMSGRGSKEARAP